MPTSPRFFKSMLAGAAMVLAGCTFMTTSSPDRPLIADSRSPILDCPVPAGFSMAEKSYSKIITNSARFVDHSYTGHDDLFPIVTFYKSELPEKGWSLVNFTQPSNKEATLHFTKKSEDCLITISERTLTFDTLIHIRIDPATAHTGE